MKLLNKSKDNKELISDLKVADTLVARGVGLLNRNSLSENEALWILRCNSIHTFFMKFSIDCVFVDKDLVVKKIKTNVQPWRLVPPIIGARSVFELASGVSEKLHIEVGDQLHVSN